MTKIKICGITTLDDIRYVNECLPEFAGFVMFFPKSKRNISEQRAMQLLAKLDNSIKSVAVTVSPSFEQVKLIEKIGFDYIQIHGKVDEEILKFSNIPIIKAFNVTDTNELEKYEKIKNIWGYVFDAVTPGSGKTFDWNLLKSIPKSEKPIILAGGLNPENVNEAINEAEPFGVDVSSGVESDKGVGKSLEKIQKFVNNIRVKKS